MATSLKHGRDEAPAYSNQSMDAIFAFSGPRAGVLHTNSCRDAMKALADIVDDHVLEVLADAWEAIHVPSALYWSPRIITATPSSSSSWGITSRRVDSSPRPHMLRLPNPAQLEASFYPTRAEAIASRGYRPNTSRVVVAIDRQAGSQGAKMFNVLNRPPQCEESSSSDNSNIVGFVQAISQPFRRSLYVLVDEDSPVDPFVDVDFSYSTGADAARTSFLDALRAEHPWWTVAAPSMTDEEQEAIGVVELLRRHLEGALMIILEYLTEFLHRKLGVAMEQCLVLSSSMATAQACNNTTNASGSARVDTFKVSLHLHLRLAEQRAFRHVRDLHAVMMAMAHELEAKSAAPPEGATREAVDGAHRAMLVRSLVDIGVYSRWRAFRLPYNVKSPFTADGAGVGGFNVADAVAEDLLLQQLQQLGISVPSSEPGVMADQLLQVVVHSHDPAVRLKQQRLVKKMNYAWRFLLPVVPNVTALHHDSLRRFLETHALRLPQSSPSHGEDANLDAASADQRGSARQRFLETVFDLACIQRDADTRTGAGSASLALIDSEVLGVVGEQRAAPVADPLNPFVSGMPPIPRCVREVVNDLRIKELLAEVFAALSPRYHTSPNDQITASHLNVQYEDAIRAFYVLQKRNRYCIKQNRHHKATFAQLYLTFGSIKVRCYANDCCERCLIIPWVRPPDGVGPARDSLPQGYPNYERLEEIRRQLFPPLPPEELVRRYGTRALTSSSMTS